MRRARFWTGLSWAIGWVAVALADGDSLRREPVTDLRPESEFEREWRLAEVAARRAGPVVMVHRGASAFAPENTLLACARAMDYGADGVEVDVRRTRDGVLVLFHDETVERLLEGFGRLEDYTLRELHGLEPVRWAGRAMGGRVPTFVELLNLTRERAMLLHLDLKAPDLEEEVAAWLTDAGLWDHVVSINANHAAGLRSDARYRPLRYKVPGLYAGRLDMDLETVRAALREPGDMILVDDPRVAAVALDRPSHQPQRFTLEYRLVVGRKPVAEVTTEDGFRIPAWVNRLEAFGTGLAVETLLQWLEHPPASGVPEAHAATDPLVTRAWAAHRLGRSGDRSARVRRALERVAETPGYHPDPALHAIDAAMAIRALGRLDATASAERLIRIFRREPAGKEFDGPEAAWRHWREKMMVIPALGELRCRPARRFLFEYVRMAPEEAARFGPVVQEEATRSLLQQVLTWDAIAGLIKEGPPAVRGTALLECLDHPTEERRRALESAPSWVRHLPGRRERDP